MNVASYSEHVESNGGCCPRLEVEPKISISVSGLGLVRLDWRCDGMLGDIIEGGQTEVSDTLSGSLSGLAVAELIGSVLPDLILDGVGQND
jgi:hypothetical protein